MRLEEYILSVGERVSAFKVLVRKPEIKRPLGSPRLRYEDNFKFDLKGKGFQYTDRFFFVSEWDSLVSSCENGNETLGFM